MLKRFAVKNYKNFNGRTEISFDNVRNYEFNKKYVKDGLLNKIIVLGKNGSGKTNLGFEQGLHVCWLCGKSLSFACASVG